MQADEIERVADTAVGEELFPGLKPVLVAEEEDVDELVRTARAGIAVLSLQLRTARHEATLAATECGPWDVDSAESFLVASVQERMKVRRAEMAKELERARTDAAQLVLSTRAEAAAMIAAAGEDTLDVLLAGAGPSAGGPDPRAPHARVAPGPPQETPRFPQPTPAVTDPAPPMPAAPVEAQPGWAEFAPPVAAPVAPIADTVEPAVAPVAAPTPPVVLPQMVPVVPDAVPADVSPLAATAVVSAIVAAAPAVAVASVKPETSRLKQFLYLDVLLPMVAVLVVLVVLLAWIG